jgi:hypothetical protein
MVKLRRIGSKLLLRTKKDVSRRPEPIFEDIAEPVYDCVYGKPEKRYVLGATLLRVFPTNRTLCSRPTRRRRRFEADMENHSSSQSSRFPATPPARWQEWNPVEKQEGPPRPRKYSKPRSPRPRSPTDQILQSYSNTTQRSPYGDMLFPMFGPQHGISTVSLSQDFSNTTSATVIQVDTLNPYEHMMRQADADMHREFLENLQFTGNPEQNAEDL